MNIRNTGGKTISKEMLKNLIELVPEEDVIKFLPEMVPEPDEIEAILEGRKDRAINWD